MKVKVKVHPKSKQEKVIELEDDSLEIFFNALPAKGRANEKLIKIIADRFSVPKSKVVIKTGEKSKMKIVEITDAN